MRNDEPSFLENRCLLRGFLLGGEAGTTKGSSPARAPRAQAGLQEEAGRCAQRGQRTAGRGLETLWLPPLGWGQGPAQPPQHRDGPPHPRGRAGDTDRARAEALLRSRLRVFRKVLCGNTDTPDEGISNPPAAAAFPRLGLHSEQNGKMRASPHELQGTQ